MNKLSELVQKYMFLKERSNLNPDESPLNVRAGVSAAVNQSKLEMTKTAETYSKEFRTNCMGVVLFGDKNKQLQFIKEAKKTSPCLVLDSDELYTLVADAVDPMFGANRAWYAEMSLRVVNTMLTLTATANCPPLFWPPTNSCVIENKDKLVEFIKNNTQRHNGELINNCYLSYKLGQLAIEQKIVDNNFIVILLNSNRTTTFSPFLGKKIVVNITNNDTVNEDFVLSHLT